MDIGCGCGAPTLEFARAVGPAGRVVGFDISGPMLIEGERRASAAGLANVDSRQVDPATAALDGALTRLGLDPLHRVDLESKQTYCKSKCPSVVVSSTGSAGRRRS